MAFGKLGALGSRGGFGSLGGLGKASGAAPVVGTIYFVDTGGSDANNGTSQATPFQTIAKVSSLSLLPGDTVKFQGGQTFTGNLIVPASGSAANPITFTSYGTGRAVIAPTNANTDAFDSLDKSYITIDTLDFTGPGTAGTGSGVYFSATSVNVNGIVVRNSIVSAMGVTGLIFGGDAGTFGFNGITLSNVESKNNKANGAMVYGSTPNGRTNSHVQMSGCSFHDNGSSGCFIGNTLNSYSKDGNGNCAYSETGFLNCTAFNNGALANAQVGLWCYESSGIRIAGCTAYNNTSSGTSDGDGLDIDEGSVDCTLEYCYSWGNKGSGILMWCQSTNFLTDNNTLRFNICENNVTGGISPYGEIAIGKSGTASVTNAKIYGNTLFNARSGIPVISIADSGVSARIFNNIIASYDSSKLVVVVGNPAGVLLAGNCYYATGTFNVTWNSVSYSSIAAWQAVITNQEKVSGSNVSVTGHPALYLLGGLSSIGADAARQTNLSPTLNTGVNLSTNYSIDTGTRDYFGGAVSTSGPYSIGASWVGSTLNVVYVTATGTQTVPADFVSLYSVETISAGGSSTTPGSVVAGGGGGYSRITSTSTPLVANVTSINCGVGVGAANTAGGDTWWNATSLANAVSNGSAISAAAQGGQIATTATGGLGGAAASGVGVLKYSGGKGGDSGASSNGGGGGAAGPLGNGGAGGAGGAVGFGSGGGGGNGGGAAGGNGATGSVAGLGGNNFWAFGRGGSTGVSGTFGGGGAGVATSGTGGNGSNGVEWDATHGSGSGPGAPIANAGLPTVGLYGAGGSGRNVEAGAQGIIRFAYKVAGVV